MERVAIDFDARAIDLDIFDNRAKKNSVYIGGFDDVAGAEWILGYFPEIAAFFEGRSRSFVG